MPRFLPAVLCVSSVFAISAVPAHAQLSSSDSNSKFVVEPLKVPSGAVLTFHLQTRLRPSDGDPLDALPQGTVLHVRILRAIDSTVQRDGSEFRGWVESDISLGGGLVIHADAEVRGLLVLLRSRSHPNGFRYELLLTELTDHGKSYPLTASLSPSVFGGPQPNAAAKVAKEDPKPSAPKNTKKSTTAEQ